jgi:hypothetical protein
MELLYARFARALRKLYACLRQTEKPLRFRWVDHLANQNGRNLFASIPSTAGVTVGDCTATTSLGASRAWTSVDPRPDPRPTLTPTGEFPVASVRAAANVPLPLRVRQRLLLSGGAEICAARSKFLAPWPGSSPLPGLFFGSGLAASKPFQVALEDLEIGFEHAFTQGRTQSSRRPACIGTGPQTRPVALPGSRPPPRLECSHAPTGLAGAFSCAGRPGERLGAARRPG